MLRLFVHIYNDFIKKKKNYCSMAKKKKKALVFISALKFEKMVSFHTNQLFAHGNQHKSPALPLEQTLPVPMPRGSHFAGTRWAVHRTALWGH